MFCFNDLLRFRTPRRAVLTAFATFAVGAAFASFAVAAEPSTSVYGSGSAAPSAADYPPPRFDSSTNSGAVVGSDAFLDAATVPAQSGAVAKTSLLPKAPTRASAPTKVASNVPESAPTASVYAPSQFEIGSDAFLDAATADVQARRAKAQAEREKAAAPGFYNEIGADVLPNAPPTVSADSGASRRTKTTRSTGLFGYEVETAAKDGDTFYERWVEADSSSQVWTKQILPQGLMYPSYLAGRKEPRLESVITYDDQYVAEDGGEGGVLWDISLGGRAPIFRYGTTDPVQPEGWEVELEGAALLRLDWERGRNLAATDYRAGVPIVYGTKRWQFKTGYYHVSSHLGDNYLMDAFRPRKHYSRDAIMFGLAFKPTADVRLYAELDYAFHCGETTDPVELQFGFEYSPQFNPYMSNWVARPFLATHAHLYEERDFGGYWATQTGVQWRSASNSLMRLGAEFFLGGDDLYQFHRSYSRKIGVGFWYDF